MKFLKQAQSFQSALLKQSRFFTSIMLVSGVGLVVAAPFLSYEASSIQCYEKAENVIIINDGETVIMKGELERKDKEIERFKKRLNALDRRMDCKDIIADLENDREELLEKLNECEKSLNDCLSNNTDLKELQDKVDALNEENEKLKKALENCGLDFSEVDELKSEITKLNQEIKILKRELNACLEKGSGDDDLKGIIKEYDSQIGALKKRVEYYKGKWESCEVDKRRVEESNKLNLRFRLHDRDDFYFNKNKFSRKQMNNVTAIKYELQHNGKSLARRLSKSGESIPFMDNGKTYTLTLKRIGKTSSYLEIKEK